MNQQLNDVLYKEEEKMFIDDDEFKTKVIAKFEEDIVKISVFLSS